MGRPRRALVADSDVSVGEALRSFMETMGFQVTTSHNGQNALDLFREGFFDLVLCDLSLPVMDGLQLLRAIKDINPRIPVILTSGQSSAETAVTALKAGAENFLSKPLRMEVLSKVVEQALSLSFFPPKLFHYDATTRQFTYVETPSRSELIAEIVFMVAQSAVAVGYTDYDLDNNVKLALVEAITNAMEHGNKWNDQLKIRLTADVSQEELRVTVEDEGQGFTVDLLPDPTSPMHLLQERGRGVFLMRAIMDEVRFNKKGNKATLVKYKNSPTLTDV